MTRFRAQNFPASAAMTVEQFDQLAKILVAINDNLLAIAVLLFFLCIIRVFKR